MRIYLPSLIEFARVMHREFRGPWGVHVSK